MNIRLGKQDWIDAAVRALSGEGVDAVRVERLARALEVTKGSFYWHFENRRALLNAVLETWKARATNDIIVEVEKRHDDGVARLRSLFTIVLESDTRLDREIRAWAAKDPSAQSVVEHIDARRIEYLETLFGALDFTSFEAAARARLVYHALVGLITMGIPAKPQDRPSRQFEIIFEMLVRNERT